VDTERTRYGSEKAGLLCGYAFGPAQAGRAIDADEAAALVGGVPADTHEFLWLHFNLSNQASRRWLAQHLTPPESFVAALDQTASTRVDVAPGSIVAAIHDLTVFGPDASEASAMLLFVNDRVLVSARRTPLRSFDRLRDSVRAGERFRSPVELFAHLLRDQAAMFVQIVRDAADKVDDVEDRLIANQVGASRATLGSLRRTLIKVQRLLTLVRGALSRLLAKPPVWIAQDDLTELRESADEIAVAAADCSALIDRIKLLQDEVFALVSEQTNRTLFTLTIVTVLALPMTIVSSFFGMNVPGVPFQHSDGFLIVVTLTVAASAVGAVLLFRGQGRP
jgi:zinc transporter